MREGVVEEARRRLVVRREDLEHARAEEVLLVAGAVEVRRRPVRVPEVDQALLRPLAVVLAAAPLGLAPHPVAVPKVGERRVVPAPLRRVVRRRHPGVPLAHLVRRVARLLELRREARHVARDGAVGVARACELGDDVHGQPPRLQRRARGRAKHVHVMTVELDALLLDQRVDSRRLHLGCRRLTVVADLRPAKVVDDHEEDVRQRGLLLRRLLRLAERVRK